MKVSPSGRNCAKINNMPALFDYIRNIAILIYRNFGNIRKISVIFKKNFAIIF